MVTEKYSVCQTVVRLQNLFLKKLLLNLSHGQEPSEPFDELADSMTEATVDPGLWPSKFTATPGSCDRL